MSDQEPQRLPTAPVTAPLAALDEADAVAVSDALRASLSPNTQRAYAAQWRVWCEWAESRGYRVMPAGPAAVAAWLADRSALGAKPSTIHGGRAALAAFHKAASLDDPCATEVVRRANSGLVRMAAAEGHTAQRQAAPLDKTALAAIRATCHLPRPRGRGMESEETAARRGAVDRALVGVLSDGALRRSEVAALKWRDVSRRPDGTGRLAVARSKTDQTGAGDIVAITTQTLADLDRIRLGTEDDSVFGLSAVQINRRVRAAALAAGLGEGYSGHSGRVGLVWRMLEAGAPLGVVQRQRRWRDPAMPARYGRQLSAGEALKYMT